MCNENEIKLDEEKEKIKNNPLFQEIYKKEKKKIDKLGLGLNINFSNCEFHKLLEKDETDSILPQKE